MRIINMMEADIRVSMYYKCHSWRKTRSSLGLLVVLLAVPLVSEELGVHALGARVLLLLLLLDTVPMVLVRLVVSRVVLGLRHGACLTQVCGERESKGARGVREDGRRKGNNTLIPRKRDAKRGEGGPPEPSGTETRDASRRTEDPRREERERRAARDGRSAPRAASPPPPKRKKEECLPAAKDRVLARLFGSSPPSFPRASPPSPRSRSRPLATPSASSSSSSLPTTSSSGLLRFAALSGPRVVLASLGGGSILHPEKGSSFECERRIWKFWLGNSMS